MRFRAGGGVALCVLSLSAAAEREAWGYAPTGGQAAVALGAIGAVVMGFVAAGNSLGAPKAGPRPAVGWTITGYVIGALELAAAGVAFYQAADRGRLEPFGFGLGALGFGGLTLGGTIWGHARPNTPTTRVSVAPTVLADARGQAAPALALHVVGW